jgi:hypothetical protein
MVKPNLSDVKRVLSLPTLFVFLAPAPRLAPFPSLPYMTSSARYRVIKRKDQRLLTRQLPTPAVTLFLPLQEGDAGGPTYPCRLAPTESQTWVFRTYFTPADLCRFTSL